MPHRSIAIGSVLVLPILSDLFLPSSTLTHRREHSSVAATTASARFSQVHAFSEHGSGDKESKMMRRWRVEDGRRRESASTWQNEEGR